MCRVHDERTTDGISCLMAFMFAVALTGSGIECELKRQTCTLRDLFYLYLQYRNTL